MSNAKWPDLLDVTAETLLDVVEWGRDTDLVALYDSLPESSGEACELGDVCEALYWYGADCHGGQWSPEYAMMCNARKLFTPCAISTGPEPDSMANDYYQALLAAGGFDTDDSE